MSATMLTSSLLATPTRLVLKRRVQPKRISPCCASYGPGFDVNDAFRQAANEFSKFQKQQQSQQRSQSRGKAGRAEAFRGSYGPFQWNFDPEQMNKFMEVSCSNFIGTVVFLPTSWSGLPAIVKSVCDTVPHMCQLFHALQEMDKTFGGDGSGPVVDIDSMQEAASCLYFPADLRESSSEYKFIIDLPGVPKSDIKVTPAFQLMCCSTAAIDCIMHLGYHNQPCWLWLVDILVVFFCVCACPSTCGGGLVEAIT